MKKYQKLPTLTGGPLPALLPTSAALDEFLEQRLASSLGPDQKAQTRQSVQAVRATISAGW